MISRSLTSKICLECHREPPEYITDEAISIPRQPSEVWENRHVATVDVIIPAFNAARYLPFALESVRTQTFDDWQIMLVDDGSTDNTAEIVVPFLERFGSKLRYIRQENGGLPAARNAAMRASNVRIHCATRCR